MTLHLHTPFHLLLCVLSQNHSIIVFRREQIHKSFGVWEKESHINLQRQQTADKPEQFDADCCDRCCCRRLALNEPASQSDCAQILELPIKFSNYNRSHHQYQYRGSSHVLYVWNGYGTQKDRENQRDTASQPEETLQKKWWVTQKYCFVNESSVSCAVVVRGAFAVCLCVAKMLPTTATFA